MFVLLSLCVFAALCAVLAMNRRRPFIDTCEDLTARLRPDRLSSLFKYADDPGVEADQAFWSDVKGVRGLISKLLDCRHLVRLVQAHELRGMIQTVDAERIYRFASLQIFYCLIALPETLLCSIWKNLPHMAARLSIWYHLQISLAVSDVCCSADSPACVFNGGRIL